ncbi:sulfurtransferase [Gemmatimonas phototrophica]|uniref:Sulfurtransferase n=1 Tax=Gemmatimonas phototrophica TaxID=1379270 RepID=A0A143BMD0_9BACT|nr:sulfurtransferase [Gemmatimonas phototrophica]AMW05725.1 thiosulfate sulfurtransferase [Gemmatimonas phototrophica]
MTPVAILPGLPDPTIVAKGYAHPERLVSTDWVAANLNTPSVRLLECNEDVLLYDVEHIPGAQKLDWHIDLNDQVERDYLDRAGFEALLRRLGVDDTTTVVFYGDKNNWWATYAFWVFQLFGFDNAVVLDGGRAKWLAEARVTTDVRPSYAPSAYVARERDDSLIRAYLADTRAHMEAGLPMVDVRSPQEYTGEKLHMPDYPQEGTLRGGHIPGARSMPWAKAAEADGSFKSAEALRGLYQGELGLSASDTVVTYCRIGERSSHTWFVLTYLLGFTNVRNYDGSWTEWGNAVRAPIRRGEQP